MIIRISVPLYLMMSTCMVFMFALIFAGEANRHERNLQKSVAALEEKIELQAKERENEIFRILETRAKTLSIHEMSMITEAVTRYSRINGHDPYLLLAIIETESGFRRRAVSHKGARGLMQIRPFVARAIANELDMAPDTVVKHLDDLVVNVKVGSYYLAKMRKRFGDLTLALEAYNLGPTRLNKFIRDGKKLKNRYSRKVLNSRDRIEKIAADQV